MISWICQDLVPTRDADVYHEHLLRTRVERWRAQPGNQGVHVFRRPEGEHTQFLLLSFWESREALRAGIASDVYPPARDRAFNA